MNENRIIELLKGISEKLDTELGINSDRAPLVTSTIYSIERERLLTLNLKISQSASISALNTNVSLDWVFSNVLCPNFSIERKKGISSLFSIQKFRIIGDRENKCAQFWIDELHSSKISGTRTFKIDLVDNQLNLNLKTPYLEPCASVLSILLKFVKNFDNPSWCSFVTSA